jgi:hypothetical protein
MRSVTPKTRNRNSRFSGLKSKRHEAVPFKNPKDIRSCARGPSLKSLAEMSTGIMSVAAIKYKIEKRYNSKKKEY